MEAALRNVAADECAFARQEFEPPAFPQRDATHFSRSVREIPLADYQIPVTRAPIPPIFSVSLRARWLQSPLSVENQIPGVLATIAPTGDDGRDALIDDSLVGAHQSRAHGKTQTGRDQDGLVERAHPQIKPGITLDEKRPKVDS